MKRILCTFCIAIVLWDLSPAIGQTGPVAPNYDVPKVIPPSPTAAAFARYGEIPVDMSSGVPRIEIPIYTIKSRKLNIPLSLSYHASGIKVNDIATPAGLGWVVSGMGMVSRTVLDRPDEQTSFYGGRALYKSEAAYQGAVANAGTTWAGHAALGKQLSDDLKYRDKQSDRFSYSLPNGSSGTFRFDFGSADFTTANCIVMPYKPIKISCDRFGPINSFGITDENGVTYAFGKVKKSEQSNSCALCYNGDANTSWYLTEMRTSDNSDIVTYEYETFENQFTLGYYSHSITTNGMVPYTFGGYEPFSTAYSAGGVGYGAGIENNVSVNFITTHDPLLKKITTATTIVEFLYAGDRSDWAQAPYRMSSIKIYDKLSGNIVKELVLNNNSYFGGTSGTSSNKRLKLNGVTFKGTGGQTDEQYTINYSSQDLPPYNSYERIITNTYLPPTFSEDYWGYYNQAPNAGLLPNEFYPSISINIPTYGSYRRPHETAGKACLISAIKYPTGGTTSFEFEQNQASNTYNWSPGAVGGYRIKTIANDNISGPFSIKTYEYGSGYVPHPLNGALFNSEQRYNWDFDTCIGGGAMGWGGSSNRPGRGITQSSSFCSLSLSNGKPVSYVSVTEHNGSFTNNLLANAVLNTGKTIYTYALPNEYPNGIAEFPEPWTNSYGSYWFDNGSVGSNLLSKEVFKNENGTYLPVAKTKNTYQVFRNNEYSTGVNVVKLGYEVSKGTGQYVEEGYLFGSNCPNQGDLNPYINDFSYKNCKASERATLLTKAEEFVYDPSGTSAVNNVTEYAYGNTDHLLPTEKRVTNSKGEILRTTFEYPQDNTVDYFAYYMVQDNILSPVIEAKNYKGNNFLSSVKQYYRGTVGTSLNMIVPDYVESKNGTNAAETRLRYHEYDTKGNVVDVSKENDVHEVYFYGYNSSLPVAKIVGTNYVTAKTYINQAILDNPTDDNTLRNHLNSLRSIPNALVTTYTHKPLVGITSETSSNGRITYYEYDASNRLKLIRDHDNNIVKKICYNYAGQPDNCTDGLYYNSPLRNNFQNQNCTAGSSASSEYYVYSGKHTSNISQADADQKALNDLNTNGQLLANQQVCKWYSPDMTGYFSRNNCGSGFNSVPVSYNLPAGSASSTISQADADQKGTNLLAIKGQQFANIVGSCYPNGIFVKLYFENEHTVNTGGYPSIYDYLNYTTYFDVRVKFFGDAACTIPVSVNNLDLNVIKRAMPDIGTTTETPESYNIPTGTTMVLLTSVIKQGPMGGGLLGVVEYTWRLASGSAYQIAP